jgi:hypothetical protein
MNDPATVRTFLAVALMLTGAAAFAQGKIHPDPAKPWPGFKAHQLSFETPQDGVARPEFRSAPFYAVILKTLARCSPVEKERAEIQKLFPENKVFAPVFECEQEPEDAIRYTNVNPRLGFIAVFAGDEVEQAEEFFAGVEQLALFPGANLRRMQAVLVVP